MLILKEMVFEQNLLNVESIQIFVLEEIVDYWLIYDT